MVPYTDDDGKLVHLNNTITRVAVGADESKWGVKALQIAADFAASWNAELEVISAVPEVKGVSSDGLATAVQPVASAGATFQVNRYSGRFHGEISPATPRGARSV